MKKLAVVITDGVGFRNFILSDFLVEADEDLIEFPQGDPDEISMKIGQHLARYIQDGDTLQLGIGNIPDAVLRNLNDKNDLGVHSEMVSDGIIPLYKNGNITNKRKRIDKGKSIISFVLGTKKIYEVIHKNPDFQFYPSEYTNDPFRIAQNPNVVSINSAIQIDLTGQICSDSIGTRFYSGFGGQVDFVRGAKRSQGGRSVIAVPSTAKNGTVSRIVPSLAKGAGVVTSRADVHYVATEYGVAYLHGKNIRERGLALVQIAHPSFRDELMSYLKEKNYVYLDQKALKDDTSNVKALIPHSKTFKTKARKSVVIYFRPLRPFDEKSIQDFFYSHRPETIYQRYLTNVESLPHAVAQGRVSVDYTKDMAIAGYDDWAPYAKMVCLGRYIRHDGDEAEIGIVVTEGLQGIGVGTFICKELIDAAKEHGIVKLFAFVSHTNVPMLKIFKKNGFSCKESKNVQGYYLHLDLQPKKTSSQVAA
jgi:RimJ/RimL family protein N-acetyltransferase/acyl CoA:acetate/3-ketoacid CoA transferase beta subunit